MTARTAGAALSGGWRRGAVAGAAVLTLLTVSAATPAKGRAPATAPDAGAPERVEIQLVAVRKGDS
ncbi:hypothetical protein O1W17_16625, partial [Streptomyces sp. H34-S5]|nr:hypothetical protein [Streptomyces sp. H34-S5]